MSNLSTHFTMVTWSLLVVLALNVVLTQSTSDLQAGAVPDVYPFASYDENEVTGFDEHWLVVIIRPVGGVTLSTLLGFPRVYIEESGYILCLSSIITHQKSCSLKVLGTSRQKRKVYTWYQISWYVHYAEAIDDAVE